MLFPTVDFTLFFLVVFAVAWIFGSANGGRKLFLLGASYFFYGYWDWRFLLLLGGSSLLNYWAGRALYSADTVRQKKTIAAIAVALNLIVLGFFKYYGFFLDSLDDLLRAVNLERDLPLMEIILPVGISFFTFQGISYVVDVYRGEIRPVRRVTDLLLYISFFPQLVAGPIVRAAQFLPQLERTPVLTRPVAGFGIALIVFGLVKKMIIAQYLATGIVDPVFTAPSTYGSTDLLVGVYAYAVQIYCDFSGYSDIAIGVAALLGYRFSRNFAQPYRASSMQDFWRRWHISLSSWLRDYLYKPLGGSRGSAALTTRNLVLTMLLGGIWHGAAWTFVLWGLFHGVVLAIERSLAAVTGLAAHPRVVARPVGAMAVNVRHPGSPLAIRLMGIVITFHIVCLGWILFRASDLDIALNYFAGLWAREGAAVLATPFVAGLVVLGLAAHFLPPDLPERFGALLARMNAIALGLFLGLILVIIKAVAPEGVVPFIYFQF